MANYTINKRSRKNGIVYCARVRTKESGVVTFSKSKTFNSKVAATRWAKETIHKVEKNLTNQPFDLIDCTLEELIHKYVERKQSSDKPLGRTAYYALRQIRSFPIAKLLVTRMNSADIVDFCLARKRESTKPSPQTISIDVSCIRKVLRIAKPMFNINIDDRPVIDAYPALHDLKLIARSNKRERRLKGNELQQLLSELKIKEKHHCCFIPYSDIFLISILTCCRIGELSSLRWQDLCVDSKTIMIRNRKNPNGSLGNNSILPLLGESLSILVRQPKISELIFPFNSRSITAGFRKASKKIGITGLRYHDLRREGASRLIEHGLSVEETARITGHKDLNILWQVYVSIQPEHFKNYFDKNLKLIPNINSNS
ncbi:integrase [Colwellia sp. PAMC 20917]|uniref:tyrosine-type recombinase/integrase n=1 Tax=Colwellia sp. PAMC 20917 TaxID=1816218 RepID=UPI0008788F87|nr:site-specific integrase [Colwellia sp. PAMC 20917]AOW76880.1 integrase [Colwellia sp. PAMC 20917]